MNAAFVLGLHGSFERIIKKAGGNAEQVSEMLMIKKYSEKFDEVFIFSHDSRSHGHLLPGNCRHVRIVNRYLYAFFGWLVLMYFCARRRIDVIELVGPSALPVLFLTGWVVRAEIILKYYYLWYNTAEGKLKRLLIRKAEHFLLGPVDYVIAANREVGSFAGENKVMPGVRESIITSVFDPEKIRADPAVSKIGGIRLISVGRLIAVKDPLTMIKAYIIAKKSVRGLKLVVCGDGDLKAECEKLADRGVHFLGFVGNVPSLLRASDIYIITSAYDASPRSLMEAMCMGLPCIATKVGGVPEYLDRGSGFLVPPGEPEALAGKIVLLSKSRSLRKRLGGNARKRVLELFDLERNLDRELDFVMKSLGRSP